MSTGGMYIGAPGTVGAAIARDDRNRLLEEEKQKAAMQSQDLQELARRAAQGNPNFLGPRTLDGQLFGRQAMGAEELLGRANPEMGMQLAMQKLGLGAAEAPVVVAENGALVNRRTGEEIYRNKGATESSDLSKQFRQTFGADVPAGYTPVIVNGQMTGDVRPLRGMRDPADKPAPNDYMLDPLNPNARVMVPGGSAAVSRAEALAKPVLEERKAFNEAATQYGTMTDLMNDDSGASDISLVYTFFKAADPQSTVREGEFATVGEKMGLPSRIIGQLNSLSQGKGFLTPDVRKSLVDAAGRAVLQRKRGLQRSYKDAAAGLGGLGVDRKAFLPFSVGDVNLADVRREFPDAQQDTAGRVYVLKNGKRRYIELDE